VPVPDRGSEGFFSGLVIVPSECVLCFMSDGGSQARPSKDKMARTTTITPMR
jgi:hypothetical protein